MKNCMCNERCYCHDCKSKTCRFDIELGARRFRGKQDPKHLGVYIMIHIIHVYASFCPSKTYLVIIQMMPFWSYTLSPFFVVAYGFCSFVMATGDEQVTSVSSRPSDSRP